MNTAARLTRIEQSVRQQTPQSGDCYPNTDVLILTGDFEYDRQENNLGNTRIYLDEAWLQREAQFIVELLSDGEWHQSHHHPEKQRGDRELWPLLQERMTWHEKCDILTLLEMEGIVEHRHISRLVIDGQLYAGPQLDLSPEYRLTEGYHADRTAIEQD